MATKNQEKAAELTLEKLGKGERVRMGEILEESGYSPAVVKNPKIVTESKGFQEILDKHGLTRDLIVSSLTMDIKAKPGRRSAELNLASDILGMKKKSSPVIIPFQQINISGDRDDFE